MPGSHATIITGAGRGIGRAVALRLARDSAVVAVGRNEAALRAVCREIEEKGGRAVGVAGDVRDAETARRALAAAEARGWDVTSLVCNAGIGKNGPTETFDAAVWREIFEVNVEGAFHFVRACLPGMIERRSGVICLMSSTAGVKGYPYAAAYTASKHALVGFARSLALEHGKHGIAAVAICPGFVESDMTERSIKGIMERNGVSADEARNRVARVNPQRRILPPEEVAEAVAFVCSDKARSLSGNPLVLSGGE